MDYIIFGLGVGATLTLAGWSLREWGATLRDRRSSSDDKVLSGLELVNQMAWHRFCRSCGAMLAMSGLLVLVVTLIATALMLSDSTGTWIVLMTFLVCVVTTLIWLGLFLHRFGAKGILRPRAEQAPFREASAGASLSADDAGATPATGLRGRLGGLVPQRAAAPPVSEPEPVTDVHEDEPARDEVANDVEPASGNRDLSEVVVVEELDAGFDEALPPAGREMVERDADVPIVGATTAEDSHDAVADDEEPVAASAAVNEPPSPESQPEDGVAASAADDTDGPREPGDTSDAAGADTAEQVARDEDPDSLTGAAVQPTPVAGDSEEAETDDQHPTGGEGVPTTASRADAVRTLRQRRIKRLMQDEPPSE